MSPADFVPLASLAVMVGFGWLIVTIDRRNR